MKWTVFDFEFTELLPDFGQPWPMSLHIACGSIMSTGDAWPHVWYERDASFMSETTLIAFVEALIVCANNGHRIVTWGGSSTDWRLLARECPSKEASIRSLALNSIDLPMCACLSIGMMMGLNAACMALGFSLKDAEASASMPEEWRLGHYEKVIQHVSNDAFATMMVLKHAEMTGFLPWISQKGHMKTWDHVVFWSVRECLARDLPPVPFTIAPNFNAKLMARWLLLN